MTIERICGVLEQMDLELLDQHYQVPSQYSLVETDLYQLLMEDQGIAIPVKSQDERWDGFVILGKVRIAADALVHSPKGAVGRVIKRTCDELIILGEPIPDHWITVPQDLKSPLHRQQASNLVEELCKKHFNINIHCHDDVFNNPRHLIVAPYSSSENSTWISSSRQDAMVVIDGSEVLVRKNDNKLVYISGPNGTVEITGEGKNLKIGGEGGITFNHNGEDVTLGSFLNGVFSRLSESFQGKHWS